MGPAPARHATAARCAGVRDPSKASARRRPILLLSNAESKHQVPKPPPSLPVASTGRPHRMCRRGQGQYGRRGTPRHGRPAAARHFGRVQQAPRSGRRAGTLAGVALRPGRCGPPAVWPRSRAWEGRWLSARVPACNVVAGVFVPSVLMAAPLPSKKVKHIRTEQLQTLQAAPTSGRRGAFGWRHH